MKIILCLLIFVNNSYGAQVKSKLITSSVVSLIDALKESKFINDDFTTHKFEIEKFEGKGAGFNIIIKIFDPHYPEKVVRKLHCQTFYKQGNGKMEPDLDKMDCK